jgi:hypothetical protein
MYFLMSTLKRDMVYEVKKAVLAIQNCLSNGLDLEWKANNMCTYLAIILSACFCLYICFFSGWYIFVYRTYMLICFLEIGAFYFFLIYMMQHCKTTVWNCWFEMTATLTISNMHWILSTHKVLSEANAADKIVLIWYNQEKWHKTKISKESYSGPSASEGN